VKKTMMIAQQLYEGIELPGEGAVGLITYMRTDSTVSPRRRCTRCAPTSTARSAPASCRRSRTTSGRRPMPGRARGDPADLDAVRPESIKRHLTPDQYYLYRLIWNRFTASQMPPAVFDDTMVDIAAGEYVFRVKGSVPKFAGWLAAFGGAAADSSDNGPENRPAAPGDAEDDGTPGVLPPLQEGQRLELKALRPDQRFTQPPPRYTEATLVKELEENGIGRPSTYASILGTIQDRDYVEKLQGKFRPTSLGLLVTDLVIPFFDDIFSVSYTAKMEEQLDEIEAGGATIRRRSPHSTRSSGPTSSAPSARCRISRRESTPARRATGAARPCSGRSAASACFSPAAATRNARTRRSSTRRTRLPRPRRGPRSARTAGGR